MDTTSFFSIDKLKSYRENNQFEVKSARGGLPGSIWETYSAFANSEGGVIVLGVKEKKDGSLIIEGVEDAQKLIKDFWNMVNNRQKVSCNILTERMVTVENVEDKEVIVIRVPRAERTTKPVYVGLDPKLGSYRRNGEGDYHCSIDEVSLMMRDAALVTEDNKLLKGMGFSVFNRDTIKRYRRLFELHHDKHIWNEEEDEVFMRRIGAMREDLESGKFYVTGAGLLMFGNEYEIITEFPQYFLDYQENRSQSLYNRWTDRVTSQSGDWSGNVLDFIFIVLPKLQAELKVPFVLAGNQRDEDTPLHKVTREAMVNACTNADFYGRRGLVVHKNPNGFIFANPGSMRVSVKEAVDNNISDPRNGVMLRMLSLIRYGERAGSGLQGIFRTWEAVYHTKPRVEISANGVDRTTLYLEFNGHQPDIEAMLTLYGKSLNKAKSSTQEINDSTQEIVGNTISSTLENGDSTLQKAGSTLESSDTIAGSTLENSESTLQNVGSTLESGDTVGGSTLESNLTNREKVILLLKENSKMTLPEVGKKLGLTRDGVNKIVAKLRREGILSRKGSTKSGEWVVNN